MSEIATATSAPSVQSTSSAFDLPLVEYFERFYTRVVSLKRALLQGDTEVGPESAQIAHQELRDLLSQQRSEMQTRYGASAVEILRRAHYAMAALADEAFIRMDWPHSHLWRDELLIEAAEFQSFRAGLEVFERIDDLIVGRRSAAFDLASIYLMTLGLGFEGKFHRWEQGQKELAGYRTRLMDFIARQQPSLDDPNRRMMPQTYESTIDDSTPDEIPEPRRWILAMAAVGVAWLLVAHFIWVDLTLPLETILQQILRDR